MRYKIIIQEEKEYSEQAPHASQTFLDTVLELTSSDPDVVAATLHSFANKVAPTKPVTRIRREESFE